MPIGATVKFKNIPAMPSGGTTLNTNWDQAGGKYHHIPLGTVRIVTGTSPDTVRIPLDIEGGISIGHLNVNDCAAGHCVDIANSTDFLPVDGDVWMMDVVTGRATKESPTTTTTPPPTPVGILDWLDANVINQLPPPLNTRTGAAVGAVAALVAYRKLFGRRGLLG